MKIQYKPIAVQNECFVSRDKIKPEITILVKLEGQGKSKKLYKNEVVSFNSKEELILFVKRNKLKVLSENEFTLSDQTNLVIKATCK